jgi:hypothetical protein
MCWQNKRDFQLPGKPAGANRHRFLGV